MGSRVLVPVDGSKMAERALEYAFGIYPDAEITVLHVVGEPSSMMGQATGLALEDDVERAAEEYAQDALDAAREIAADYDREITTEVKVGHPARAIINRSEAFDAVVIGTHGGKLVDRLLVGNVAEAVFRRSPVPVTVVR